MILKINDKMVITKKTNAYLSYDDGAFSISPLYPGTKGTVVSYCMTLEKICVDIDGQTWEVDIDDLALDEEPKSWKERGLCPECGCKGLFINLGLFCSEHGVY